MGISFLNKLEPNNKGLVRIGPVRIVLILFSRKANLNQKTRLLILCLSQKFNVLSYFVDKRGNIKWRKVSIGFIRIGLSYFTSTPAIFRRILSYVLYLLMNFPRGEIPRNITTFAFNGGESFGNTISVFDKASAIDVQAYVNEPAQIALQKTALGLIWSPIATDVLFEPVMVDNDKVSEIFYGGNVAVEESILRKRDYKRRLKIKKEKELYMSKAYSEASGDRVLMEWSLKLIYSQYLESGDIYPIEDIDKLSVEEIAERLGSDLAFEARYTAMPIVAKLELKFGIVSLAYSERLSVSRFTEIIKQL